MAFIHCPAVHCASNVTRGGVDLHTNSFTICRLHDDGSEVFETFTLSASALQAFCMSLDADDEIAVEGEGRPWPQWGRESALNGNTAWFCGEIRPVLGVLSW